MLSAASLLIALSLPTAPPLPAASTDLRTVAEESGFVRTGRYDEVIRLCDRFAESFRGSIGE